MMQSLLTSNDYRIMTRFSFPHDSVCENQRVGRFCQLPGFVVHQVLQDWCDLRWIGDGDSVSDEYRTGTTSHIDSIQSARLRCPEAFSLTHTVIGSLLWITLRMLDGISCSSLDVGHVSDGLHVVRHSGLRRHSPADSRLS